MGSDRKKAGHFRTTARENVPTGRKGKHNEIVAAILKDLETLAQGQALKIPLRELPDVKVNIRSALNRATRKGKLNVATAADDDFLYVWNI